MAYAAVVTATKYKTFRGREQWRIVVAETEAAATSEWDTSGMVDGGGNTVKMMPIFTVIGYKSTLVSGTGTTIQPRLGKVTGWVALSQNDFGQQDAASAHVNDQTRLQCDVGIAGNLFGKSVVNDATADHVITTEIHVMEGHVE